MKKEYLVPASVVLLVAVFTVAAYVYDQHRANEINAQAKQKESLLVRDHSPTKGNKDARVTLVEFFDPACETCGQSNTNVNISVNPIFAYINNIYLTIYL